MTIYNPLWHQKKQVKEESGLQELRLELEEPLIIRQEKSEESDGRGVVIIELF